MKCIEKLFKATVQYLNVVGEEQTQQAIGSLLNSLDDYMQLHGKQVFSMEGFLMCLNGVLALTNPLDVGVYIGIHIKDVDRRRFWISLAKENYKITDTGK
jgi:ribosome biogenesis protein Nip4